MPYDDPALKQFENYYLSHKPSERERAENWAIAIGLQKVDGLTPSEHLISVAKRHIEGKISSEKAVQLVDRYYETKSGHDEPEDKKEADRVSARINQIIEEDGFYLSPTYLTGLHGLIFEGVFPHAGFVRDVNLRKREWVLRGDSVTYGHAPVIEKTLEYDFDREKGYSYARKGKREIVKHFARFIAGIWQIHPFREGNTRTIAVFAIKYLRSMRIAATNELFAENSWYFRNALVRANYDNPLKGIARNFEPLERFFGNLMLGEQNELKSRYLLVDLTEEDKRKLRELSEGKTTKGGLKSGQKKAVRKSGQKSRTVKSDRKPRTELVEQLQQLMRTTPNITQNEMARLLGIARSTLNVHIGVLKKSGRLRRVGPDKGGHWEVIG